MVSCGSDSFDRPPHHHWNEDNNFLFNVSSLRYDNSSPDTTSTEQHSFLVAIGIDEYNDSLLWQLWGIQQDSWQSHQDTIKKGAEKNSSDGYDNIKKSASKTQENEMKDRDGKGGSTGHIDINKTTDKVQGDAMKNSHDKNSFDDHDDIKTGCKVENDATHESNGKDG